MNLPIGYSFSAAKCGLKKNDYDLALVRSEPQASVVAVYTKNKLVAAPVLYCKKYDMNPIEAIIINSKNANAATGKSGYKAIETVVKSLAKKLKCAPENILMSSTGVIGEPLPKDKILDSLDNLVDNLDAKTENNVPDAIRTTDKYKKTVYKNLEIDGKTGTFFAMAKGAGMIHPNMATMLVYIFTDIAIEKKTMKIAFKYAIDKTLNRISVDGDTSTNDTAMLFSNGALGNNAIKKSDESFTKLCAILEDICLEVAKLIVSDGEGATKFISLHIKNAKDKTSAFEIAKSIAISNLVKTAFFGCDANWGRIIVAAGYANAIFDPELATLILNGFVIYKKGTLPKVDIKSLEKSMQEHKQSIILDCGYNTKIEDVYYFSDLSHEYISVNSAYRT